MDTELVRTSSRDGYIVLLTPTPDPHCFLDVGNFMVSSSFSPQIPTRGQCRNKAVNYGLLTPRCNEL